MKKHLITIAIAAFALFSSHASAQSFNSGSLFSFRGVLYGILEEAKDAAEKVASPFFESKTTSSGNIGESSFSFAILGDTQYFDAGNPNGYFQKAVKGIVAAKPDLVISTGDLVGTSDSYSEYIRKFSDWKRVAAPILSKTYAAMGNHDNVENKGVKAWKDSFDFPTNGPVNFKEQTYSFDFKNSHFVVLNSNNPKEHLVNSEQRTWLEQDLAKSKKENIFVFFHEPAYPVSSKITEGLDKNPGERDALWQILKKHNVTAVFNGHEHIVSRRKIDDIYQFVFGSTDAFDHDLPAAGVAEYANQGQGRFGIVNVNSKKITVETRDSKNAILNSFTFSK